jgi:hypothetical protein
LPKPNPKIMIISSDTTYDIIRTDLLQKLNLDSIKLTKYTNYKLGALFEIISKLLKTKELTYKVIFIEDQIQEGMVT